MEKEAAARQRAYDDFLSRLRRPCSRGLVAALKRFIVLVLGESPQEAAGQPPLDARVADFYAAVMRELPGHEAWRGAGEEELDAAREGLEKYIMSKLVTKAFGGGVGSALAEADRRLRRHAGVLAEFAEPKHLDVPAACANDLVLSLAAQELRKMTIAQ